jgi:hypothetical protein
VSNAYWDLANMADEVLWSNTEGKMNPNTYKEENERDEWVM